MSAFEGGGDGAVAVGRTKGRCSLNGGNLDWILLDSDSLPCDQVGVLLVEHALQNEGVVARFQTLYRIKPNITPPKILDP